MKSKQSTALRVFRLHLKVPISALLLALCPLWNVQVKGATLTWDAAAGDGIVITDGPGIWTNGLGNWNNAGTDVNWNNATLDDAVFGGGTLGAAGIVTLGGPITAATLTFNLPNGGGAYTIAGGGANILTLNTGITANSAANISAPITLGGANTWSNTSTGLLNISGNITNGANLLTLGVTNTGGMTLSGNILGATAGGITVNSSGSGVVTLSGINTQTGTTTLTSGVLRATTNAGALGAGSLALTSGDLQLANDGNLSFNRNTTVGGAVQITSDRVTSGAGTTHTLGTLAIGAQTLTIGGGSNVNSGVAGMTFGAVTSSGASTFTVNNPSGGGVTLLTLASIAPTAATTLTFNGTGNTTVTGIIGATNASLSKSGAGTLTLGGANTFTGGVTLTAGTLNINAALALGTTSTFTNNGGTIDNATAAAIAIVNPMTLGGNLTFTGSRILTQGTGAIGLGAGATRTVTVNNNSLTLGGIISGNSSIIKAGTGNLTLSGVNTFGSSGQSVTLSAGTLSLGNAAALGAAANTFIINGGAIDASAATTTADARYAQTWNSDFAYLGTNALTFGTTRGGGSTNTMVGTRQVDVRASTLTYHGNVLQSGTSGLTKAGAGTLVLTGSGHAYTGLTTIKGGTLQIEATAASAGGTLSSTTGLDFRGTGAFTYANVAMSGNNRDQDLASAAFTSGDGSINLSRTVNNSGLLSLDFATAPTRSAGATSLLAVFGNATLGTNGTNYRIGFTGQTTNALMGPGYFASITAATSPSGVYNLAWYDSGGFVREINYAAPAEGISVAGGNLSGNPGVNLRTTAASTLVTSDNFNTLNINSASTADLALTAGQTLTLGGTGAGVLLRNGGGATTISGGTGITSGTTGNPELIIRSNAAADLITLTTPILSSTGAVTKSGLGTLNFGTTGAAGTMINNAYTGTLFINAGTLLAVGTGALNSGATQGITLAGGATLSLRMDGNNTGATENVNLLDNVSITGGGVATINIDRNAAGSGGLFLTPLNKTLQFGTLTMDAQTLQVTPATAANGYGLEFTGTTTLSSTPIFSVTLNAGAASNQVQGLTLSGQVTGTTGGIFKLGTGTMVLSNNTNDFTGNITIGAGGTGTTSFGVLSFNSNAALGNVANTITLNGGTGAGATTTLRAFGGGAITTSRTINLAGIAANNIIEVTAGTSLQLNTAWTTQNGFVKADNGTLILNADNGAWLGGITINAGALRIANNNALGSTAGITTVAGNQGAALQLAGVNISESITLTGIASTTMGINGGGSLQAVSGTNSVSGLVTLATAQVTIGADTGATLNLQGGISGTQALLLNSEGTINLSTIALPALGSLTKFGAGTTNLTVSSPAYVTALTVSAGTFSINGAGTIGNAAVANTVSAGAVLTLDNSGTNVLNRLGGATTPRTMTLGGGTLNFIGSSLGTSSESTGALTLNRGGSFISITPDAGQQSNLVFASLARTGSGANGTAVFSGTNLGSAAGNGVATIAFTAAPTFVGQAGASGTVNKAILPYILLDATAGGLGTLGFATTSGAANDILRPLGVGESVATLTPTANVALAASATVNGVLSINSLNLADKGVTIRPLQPLTVQSGGVITTAGNTGISGGILTTASATDLIVHTLGIATDNTTISSTITTTGTAAGLTKTGNGILTLTAMNYYTGNTVINKGTLKLDGGTNTILAGQPMVLNAGGTLNLNGNVQTTGVFFSDSLVAGTGGNVVGTATTSTLVVNQDGTGRSFSGVMSGGMSFARSHGSGTAATLSLSGVNTYTGKTLLNGNVTQLIDGGTLSGAGGVLGDIDVNYATFTLNNTGTTDLTDRVNDNAAINLRGGTISFLGRAQTASTETLGAVTLAQGTSFINSAAGGTGVNSAELTLTSLTRAVGGGNLTITTTQGSIGSGSRIFVPTINGVSTSTIGGGLTNGIIGGWAIIGTTNPSDFASYVPGLGIGSLGQAGYQGYSNASSSTTTIDTAGLTDNININTAVVGAVTVTTDKTINSLRMGNVTTNTIAIASGKTLTLSSGGLLFFTNQAHFIGSSVNIGNLTTSGPELFAYIQGSGVQVINSAITGAGVTFVKGGSGNINLAGTNTYGGGTMVNQGTLTLAATATLPGNGLTISGGTVTQTAGAFITPQVVTLNGLGTLTLAGNNILNGLVFNNNGGGTTAPTVTPTGTLTLGGNVTASSSNVASTSIISGGELALGATRTFTVNPIQFNSQDISPDAPTLLITSSITGAGAGIIKTGNGILHLTTGNNTFTGGIDLQAGGLLIAAATSMGNGTLTIGNNTTIGATATTTAANAVTVNGNFTFGTRGPTTPAALTLSGPVAWGTSTRTVTGNSIAVTNTFSGVISGSGGITKEGLGTIALTGVNTVDWTGANDITVNNGLLQVNNAASLGANPGSVVSNNIVLNGGGLSGLANTFDISANRGVLIGDATGSGTGILDSVAGVMTILGIVADNGAGADALLKTGAAAGVVALGGANTYTGLTYINGGALRAQNNSALGTTAAGTIVLSGAALEISGLLGDVAIGAEALTLNGPGTAAATGALRNILGNNSYAGAIDLASATTRINSDAGLLTLTGGITTSVTNTGLTFGGAGNILVNSVIGNLGTGTVTKDGAGTTTFALANLYTAATSISAGALRIQNVASLGTTAAGTTVTATGGALELDGSGGALALTAEAITLNGTGVSTGGALRNIEGNNSISNAVTLGSASRINSDLDTLTLSGGFTGAFGLTFGGAGTVTVSTTGITDAAATLTKDGTGTLNLSAANTYTGATAISAGTTNVTGSFGNTAIGLSGGILSLQAADAVSQNTVTVSGTGSLVQTVTDSLGGTAALTVNGALASATLSLANDFTGATTLTAGTLQLQNAGSVAGSAVALNGGTLQLRNNAATAFTTASTTIGGNTTIDVDRLSSGSNLQHSLGATSIGAFTLNVTGANGYSLGLGATTLTGAATFNPTSANVAVASVTAVDQNLTLDGTSLGSTVGAITTGLGTLTKSNTSTWTLNADNTYTGATAINGGTLVVAGAAGRLSGTTSITLAPTGVLEINNTAANNLGDRVLSSAITSTGGGITFSHDAAALTNYSESLGVLNITSGLTKIITSEAGVGQTSTLTFADLVRTGNATLNFADNNLGTSPRNRVVFTNIGGVAPTLGLIGGWATVGSAFAEYVDLGSSTFTVRAAAATSLGGETTWLNDTLNDTPSSTDDLVLDSAANRYLNTLALSGVTPLTVSGTGSNALTLKSGIVSGDANHLMSVPFLKGGSDDSPALVANGTTNLPITVSSNMLTISSVISNHNNGSFTEVVDLTKGGAGTLKLTGNNTFTGGFNLNGGTLILGSDTALGTGVFTINGSTTVADGTTPRTLRNNMVFNSDETFGAATVNTGALTFTGTVALNGNRIITVDNPVDSWAALTGVITSTSNFTKSGSGTLLLTAANTFGSTFTVNGGVLATGGNPLSLGATTTGVVLDNGAVLATLSGTLNPSSGKVFNIGSGGAEIRNYTGAATTIDDNGQLVGSGNLTKTGNGTLNLGFTGSSTPGLGNFTGQIFLNEGLTFVGHSTGLGSNAVGQGTTIAPGAALGLYSGPTTIAGEPISVGGSGILGAGAIFNTATSSLFSFTPGTGSGSVTLTADTAIGISGAAGITISSPISGTSFALNKVGTGAGVLTLAGVNTYTGATNVLGGTLTLSGAGTILTTSGITVANGGSLLITNALATNVADRVDDTITLNGGTLSFANTVAAASYAETLPSVVFARGANTVNNTQNTSGQSILTLTAFSRTAGATVDFTGTGLGLNTQSQIVMTAAPTLDDGIIGGWATAGNEFAKYAAGSVTAMVAADYDIDTDPTLWTTASNVKIAKGNLQLTAAGTTTINSLNIAPGVTPNPVPVVNVTAGKTLRIGSGGILVGSGGFLGGRIANGTLTAGNTDDTAAELIFHIGTANALVNAFSANSVIANNGTGALSVVKSGIGYLELGGVNTFTGGITVNAGTLSMVGSALNNTGIVVNGGTLADNTTTNASNPFGTAGITFNGGTFTTGTPLLRTYNNAITVGGDVTLAANANGLILGGAVGLGASQRTLTVTNTATLSGIVSGTAGFIKAGAGSLVLSNTGNDYTGQTAVTAGSLVISADANLGAAPVSPTAKSIFLNGGTLNTTASFTLDSDRGLYLGASGGTISTNVNTTLTIGSVIDGGALTKTGPGDLILSGNNTFTGNVSIGTPSNGNITITNSSALGIGPKTITVIDNTGVGANGSYIQLDGSGGDINLPAYMSWTLSSGIGSGGIINLAGNNTIQGNITLTGGGGSSSFTANGGSLTLAGNMTNEPAAAANRTAFLKGAASGTISGAIADTGAFNMSVTKSDAGTWILTGANTFVGATAINGGTLQFSGVNGASGGSTAYTLGGGGALTLANTFAANNTNRIADTATLTTNGTAGINFTHNGTVVNYSETVGDLTLGTGTTGGALTITTSRADSGQTSALTFASLAARNVGTTVNFSGIGLGDDGRNRVIFTTPPTLIGTTPVEEIIGAWATVNGTDFATYDTGATAGSVRALQAGSYNTGADGTWLATDNVKITAAGTTALGANRTIGTLNFIPGVGGSTLDIFAAQTLALVTTTTTGGLLMSGADNGVIANGTLTAGSAAGAELIISQFGSGTLDIQSVIGNNAGGAISLVKSGSGTLQLSGNNSLSGTILNEGRLILANANATGTANNNITINGGTLSLNNNSATVTTLTAHPGIILENANATGNTLTANLATATTFNGLLRDGTGGGALAFTKSGAGVLTLTGVNTYTGITTLSAGTVQIFAESGLGSNPGAFSASQLTLNGGTLQTSGTFAIDDSNRGITVGASGGTFSTDALTTLTLSNPIAGAGAGPLTKLGAGTLVLGSTNTWTAATPATALTINAGTVQFSTDANLGNAANQITLGGGTFEFTGGTTVSGRTVNIPTTGGTILANGTGGAELTLTTVAATSGVTVGGSGNGNIADLLGVSGTAGNLTKTGTGTWRLTAATTSATDRDYDLIVSGGVLELNAANAFVGDDITINAGGTLRLGITNGFASVDDITLANGAYLDLGSFNGTIDVLNGNGGYIFGSGTLTTAGQTYSNTTTINANVAFSTGTGVTSRAVTMTAATDTAIFNGSITSAAVPITVDGLGTMVMRGDNAYIRTTTIGGATLVLDYGTNNGSKLHDTSALIFNGARGGGANAGRLILTGANLGSSTTETVSGFDLRTGEVTVTIDGDTTALTAPTLTRNYGYAATAANQLFAGGVLILDVANSNGDMRITGAPAASQVGLGGVLTRQTGTNVFQFASTDASGNLITLNSVTNNAANTWANGDVVNTSAALTGTVAAGRAITALRFDFAGPSTLTLGTGSANSLRINSGNILITPTVAANATTLGVAGSYIESGNAARDLVIMNYGTGAVTLAANLRSDQSLTYDKTVATGALTISGNNTYYGPTTIVGGTVTLSGGNAVGDLSQIVFGGSSVVPILDLNGTSETIGSLQQGITVATGTIATGTSSILTINQNNAGTFNGIFTGSGTVIKQGAATLTLGQDSSFTGTVRVHAGTLVVSGAGNTGVNDVTSYFLRNGTFDNNQDDNTVRNRTLDTAHFTLQGTGGINGLYVHGNDDQAEADTIGKITLEGGANTVTLVNSSAGVSATARITASDATSGLVRQNSSTLLIRGRGLGNAVGSASNSALLTVTNGVTAQLIGGGASVAGADNFSILPYAVGQGGASGETGVGDTFVTFDNASTVAGSFRPLDTTVGTGEYQNDITLGGVTDNYSLTGTGTDTVLAASKIINALRLDSAVATTVTGAVGASTLTLTSGALLVSGALTATVGDANLTALNTGAVNEYVIHVTNAAGTLTMNAALTNPTATGTKVTKSGAGLMILGVANNFGGGLTLNQGTIRFTNINQLGSATGAINLAGGTLQWGSATTSDIATGRTVSLLGPTATFTPGFGATAPTIEGTSSVLDTNGNNVTLTAAIGNNGTGGLTKTGNGTLTLNVAAATPHTGMTQITGGTLAYGVSDLFSNTGDLVLNGTGSVLSMGAFNDTVGSIVLLNGSITGTGTLTTTGESFQLAGGNTNFLNANSIAPILAGSTRLVKTGAATTTVLLSNVANTFTGGTEIQGGILQVTRLANAGVASSLGAPLAGADPSILLGFGTGTGTLQYVGSTDSSTNRPFILIGTSGGGTISSDPYQNAGVKLVLTGGINGTNGGTALGAAFATKTLTLKGFSYGANEVSGVISDFSNDERLLVNKTDGGIWNLTGLNTYRGTTTVTQGTLGFNSIGNVNAGIPTALGSPTTAPNGTITVGNSTTAFGGLRYTGSANSATDRIIAFGGTTGTRALESTGSGTITYNTAFTATGAGAKTLILRGSGNGVINASFTNLSTTVTDDTSLTKNGTGTWTLNGNVTTEGMVTVNQGNLTLAANGRFGAAALVGFTLQDGTLNLDNSGTNVTNRLGARPITMGGGTLSVTGPTSGSLSETTGTFNVDRTSSTLTIIPGGGTSTNNTFTIGGTYTATLGGSLLVNGAGLGSTPSATTANVKFTTAPTFTNNIRAEIVGNDGTNVGLVKNDPTNGLKVLSGADYSVLGTQPLAPGFAAVANATQNALLTSNSTLTTNNTVTSLTMDGITLSMAGGNKTGQNWNALGTLNTLTLTNTTGGAIVTRTGAATISGGAITASATTLYLHVFGTSLALDSFITGTGGITKAESGSLSLNKAQYYTGTTVIGAGNVVLNSGAANTIMVAPTMTIATLSDLRLNGGSLDLNGQNQTVGFFTAANTVSGTSGNITSASAATFTTASATATNYAGTIGGALSFTKAASNATGILTLTAPQTYTGTTNVIGGTLTLADDATLASTTINVNYATLALSDAGVANIGIPGNANRISDAATVTLRGGSLTLAPLGGVSFATTETIGTVAAAQGANTLGTTLATSASYLTIGNLTRATGATLNFTTNAGTLGAATANDPRFFLNQINGVAPTNQQFLGAAVIANSTDFAAYSATTGVGAYGTAGFPAYTTQAIAVANVAPVVGTFATGVMTNINATAAGSILLSGNTTTGALRVAGAFANDLLFTAGTDVLQIESGGLLRNNVAGSTTIGDTTNRGVLTAGVTASTSTELVIYNAQNTVTINSVIKDTKDTFVGGTGTVTLIKSGAGGMTLTAANLYTGGTIVNQGTLTLNVTTPGNVAVPGNLIINGATVTQTTNAQQIATTSEVTINGSGTLTLVGANTLKKLTLNNSGGVTGGLVTIGATSLTVTDAAAINVTNDNIGSATPPTIAGTALIFSNVAAAEINVSGSAPIGASITAPITTAAAGIVKKGNSTLVLNAANTYTATNADTAFVLEDGGLILGNAAAFGNAANKLVIGNGTAPTVPLSLMANGTLTIANATIIGQNFTIGGTLTANALTLTGAMDLGAATRTITVTSPTVTGVISGVVSGAVGTGLTKAGNGTLTLGGASANTYTGPTTVNAGLLKLGAASTNAITDTSALLVKGGATFDIAGRNETVGSLSDALVNDGGLVTNSGAVATLTVGGDGTDTTFSGVITNGTNALSLTKIGVGIQTLSGANTYRGKTIIQDGAISVGSINSVATPTPSVSSNLGAPLTVALGTIDFGAAATTGRLIYTGAGETTDRVVNLAGTTGGGTLDQSGTGVLKFTSNLTATGAGTKVLTLQGSTAGSGEISGVIVDNLTGTNNTSLAKEGSGTWVLSGANAYTGNTVVTLGTLQLGNGTATGSLNTASAISVGTGATFAVKQSDTVIQGTDFSGAVITGNGGFAQTGSGTTILNAANAYTGTTTVSAGTLLINGDQSAATGSVGVTGATLGGNGIIGGAVTVNATGILAPGAAAGTAGTLTLASNLAMAGSGSPETRLSFDFTNATGNAGGEVSLVGDWWSTYSGTLLSGNGGQSNDLVNLTATTPTITWDTGGRVSLNQLGSSYSWILGDILNLLDWNNVGNANPITGSLGTALTDFDLPTLGGGLAWDTSRFMSTGAIAVTPEPGRALLMMLGLLALFFRRRRR